MTTDLVYHDIFTKHEMDQGHPESPLRVQHTILYLKESRVFDNGKIRLVTPSAVNLDEILAIHEKSYLNRLKEISESGGGYFTLDTQANRYTYDAAIIAANGGVMAVDRILDGVSKNAVLLCRPPGHHAEASRAFGFCFINNIAVAANHLIDCRGIERVMIVDYDAHHGNGTQNAFFTTNKVLYVGIHQDGRTLFPGTGFIDEIGVDKGTGYNINVPLYPKAGNKSYEIVFDEIVKSVASSFKPEFILVSAGYDAHFRDPLTSLGLTFDGFAMMNKMLVEMANDHCNGRLAFFLEGGYDLEVLSTCIKNLLEEISGEDVEIHKETNHEGDYAIDRTKEIVKTIHSKLAEFYF